MSLRALRTLSAIARHGSFARAGEAVGLTQSAVSLQVKALEQEFEVRLFDRSRRLPTLTEAGKIVLTKAEEVIALYDQIPEALSDERSLVGRIRVGTMPSVLSTIMPDAMVALNQAHPRIRVHVSSGLSGELTHQVAAGELDIAITVEPVPPYPSNLVWTPLYEDRLWVIAPPGNNQRSQRELLSKLPFIRFDNRAWSGRAIDQELRRLRIRVREEIVLGSPESIITMVEKGLGVAVIPLSDDSRKRIAVTCLPFGEPQLSRRIVFLEREGRTSRLLANALARAVEEVASRINAESSQSSPA
jgi:DNA-binding transcriptional LysR family regulator